MKLELHDYRRCPFCIRTRIVLYLKKIPYDIVDEPLRKWTEWMRKLVEQPRVPVLRIIQSDGSESVMPESNDINMWLDDNFGEREFTPEVASEKYKEMSEWFDWCANVFKHQIDLYKYGKDRVFDIALHKEHGDALSEMIQKLEDSLSASDYLLGDTITLADVAIIPFIRQIMRTRNGEYDLRMYPRVLAWSATILEQPWFDDVVMKKREKKKQEEK